MTEPIENHPDRDKPHVILYMETMDSDPTCTGVVYDNLMDAFVDAKALYLKGYRHVGAVVWNDNMKNNKFIKNKPPTSL